MTALASFVVAALAVGAGTSYADPTPVAPQQGIGYETKLVDKTVVTTLDAGFFEVSSDRNTVAIKDGAGNSVVDLPLSFRLNDVAYPLVSNVSNDGRVLELTPPANVATTAPVYVKPVASLEENQRAQEAFATQFGIATAIGSFVGLAIGAVVGAILVGIPTCATIIACLPGIAAGAAVGGVIGTLVVGGPTLLIAGIDLIQTLTAPPGTTKWNY